MLVLQDKDDGTVLFVAVGLGLLAMFLVGWIIFSASEATFINPFTTQDYPAAFEENLAQPAPEMQVFPNFYPYHYAFHPSPYDDFRYTYPYPSSRLYPHVQPFPQP